VQWELGLKWPECEVDCAPPSSAEIKREWSYACTSTVGLHDMDNFNFIKFVPVHAVKAYSRGRGTVAFTIIICCCSMMLKMPIVK
jgi:hypothetical protein